jgi:DNA (cytosine-5)-methyltransferase 3A
MKNQITMLSLFGGLGGGRLSAEQAGFKVTDEYVSEVNQSSVKVYSHHFPDAKQVGDIRFLRARDYIYIDIITAGSPCQNFSMAGRRKGMVTKTNIDVITLKQYLKLKKQGFEFEGQSYLFWEFVRLVKEINELREERGLGPVKFLLENVVIKNRKWEEVINNALGVKPIMIDSAKVSAQSRERYYWTNIKNVTQPNDLNITVSDVIPEALSAVHFCRKFNKETQQYERPLQFRKKNLKFNTLTTTNGSISKNGRYNGNTFYMTKDGVLKQLTILEQEIIQGLEAGYTNVAGVSMTQRIKMVGNAWSIPTVTHIFKCYLNEINQIEVEVVI